MALKLHITYGTLLVISYWNKVHKVTCFTSGDLCYIIKRLTKVGIIGIHGKTWSFQIILTKWYSTFLQDDLKGPKFDIVWSIVIVRSFSFIWSLLKICKKSLNQSIGFEKCISSYSFKDSAEDSLYVWLNSRRLLVMLTSISHSFFC